MTVRIVRKRSPRAPTISLKEAVDRASKVYEKEGRHPANADIVAQHLGYKSADNGAAKQALASLGYYGLLERPSDGMLAVTKSFEEFRFAPTEELRMEKLQKWLVTPSVFSELLEKFQGRLPSDASLKFELIQKGFNPATADECLAAFIGSVQYVGYPKHSIQDSTLSDIDGSEAGNEAVVGSVSDVVDEQNVIDPAGRQSELAARVVLQAKEIVEEGDSDRIPVRLGGGRRAWLVIPSPLYAADKRRLISHIELLLADDEE